MKSFINIGVSVLILGAGIVGFVVLGQKPDVPKDEKSPDDGDVDVVTAKATRWEQPISLELDGEASTWRVVTIGTEVEGRVTRKADKSRSGTWVEKDEILFEIDSSSYQLEVDRLTAQKEQAIEELAAVGVDLTNTAKLIVIAEEDWNLRKRQLARMEELLKRETANVAEVEEAMKQELVARNSLRGLENQNRTLEQQRKTKQAALKLVEAQLAKATLDLERCTISSTLEGRIVDDLVEEGDYLKSGDDLVHISDSSRMEVKCQLQADELAWIWKQHQADESETSGDADPRGRDPLELPIVKCEVAFEFEGEETIWQGELSRLEGTGIDRETRTFPCRVLIENPKPTQADASLDEPQGFRLPTLLSGLFVTVRIPVKSPTPLLRLPREAVRPGGQVWCVRSDVLGIHYVRTVHTTGESVLIREGDGGLLEGDSVVVSPLASVKDGMKVSEQNGGASNPSESRSANRQEHGQNAEAGR